MNSLTRKLTSQGRFGVLLLVIGALLAVDSHTKLFVIYKLWPVLSIILGFGFFGIFKQRARKESLYLCMGIFFIGFSLLALYCNFTSWKALTMLWPLFITNLGIALIATFLFCRPRRIQLLSGLLLVSLSVVFFLIFSLDTQLWWTGFILAGFSFLLSEMVK